MTMLSKLVPPSQKIDLTMRVNANIKRFSVNIHLAPPPVLCRTGETMLHQGLGFRSRVAHNSKSSCVADVSKPPTGSKSQTSI